MKIGFQIAPVNHPNFVTALETLFVGKENVWNFSFRSVCPARQIGLDCRSAPPSSIVLWRSVCTAHTHTHETYVSEKEAEWRQDLVKRRVQEAGLPLGTTAGNIWRARCSTTTKVVVSCCSRCCWTSSQTPISFSFFLSFFFWGGGVRTTLEEFRGRRDKFYLPCPEFH